MHNMLAISYDESLAHRNRIPKIGENMLQTIEQTLPISVGQQANAEKDLIEVALVTGQKLYLSSSAARMLACDLIQAAYQAEIHNQRRVDNAAQKGKAASPLSVVAAA